MARCDRCFDRKSDQKIFSCVHFFYCANFNLPRNVNQFHVPFLLSFLFFDEPPTHKRKENKNSAKIALSDIPKFYRLCYSTHYGTLYVIFRFAKPEKIHIEFISHFRIFFIQKRCENAK